MHYFRLIEKPCDMGLRVRYFKSDINIVNSNKIDKAVKSTITNLPLEVISEDSNTGGTSTLLNELN